jgi:FkbM family methyltransferase
MPLKDAIRKFGLKFLRATGRDIKISHHWVPGQKIKLNSFLHKGFWYHGKNRERETMELFASCIHDGDVVIEVGGHIGYISTYFSSLVGSTGSVIVFEPGHNNLPYTRVNVSNCRNVTLIEKGAGAAFAELSFFEDSLTGQNNSFVQDFQGLKENGKAAFTSVTVKEHRVEVVPIDSITANLNVAFIKIDVEGFELSVLKGAVETLKKQPILMVEIQADQSAIFHLLRSSGYELFTEFGKYCSEPKQLTGNIFCFHAGKHAGLMRQLDFQSLS